MRLTLLFLLCSFAAPGAEPGAKEFSIVIDANQKEYTIDVGGTQDPLNLEIVFENIGSTAVKNPRMTVNGLYDWFDVPSIVAEATRGCETDEEKAFALWQWVLYKRYQLSPVERAALHPVRAMNGYGYGICGHNSAWLKCLWKAAGINARVQELWGHTVAEAYYDGAWHMFDGNTKVFYPARDNRTVASLAMLEKDPDLIARGLHSHDPWVRRPDTLEHSREMVHYIATSKDNYEEDTYDSEIAKDFTMAMSLRPGESLVRWWEPRLAKSERRDAKPPQRYANGQLTWAPDLKSVKIGQFLSIPSWGNIASFADDGRKPAIHVKDLQNKEHTRPAVFSIPVESAYPIVGGHLQGTLVKEGTSSLDLASVFFGRPGWRKGDLFHAARQSGLTELDIDLDPNLRKGETLYKYEIGFAFTGNSESAPPTQAGLDSFRLVTDLQVSPHSLPALSLGKNTIRFWHASPDNAKIRVTHRWREVHGVKPPPAVNNRVTPGDGGVAASVTPLLRWDAAQNAADYQVMVCTRPDCKWPLAPALHQSVGSPTTEWQVPASFLNPATRYYWRVRPRDEGGRVGEWSRVFSFTTPDR